VHTPHAAIWQNETRVNEVTDQSIKKMFVIPIKIEHLFDNAKGTIDQLSRQRSIKGREV